MTETTGGETTTLYEAIGGEETVRRLVRRFYELMDTLPEAKACRDVHPPSLDGSEQKLFDYLSGWLGGPPLYFQRPDHKCIVSAHRPYAIGEAERDAWMFCMRQAMDDCDVDREMRELIDKALLRMAEGFRNR